MIKLKSMLMKGMTRIMFDCDTATLLITKSEFQQLDWLTRLRLKLHLMSCKFCRKFAEQSRIISLHLNNMKNVGPENISMKLDEEQKKKLVQTIEKEITAAD